MDYNCNHKFVKYIGMQEYDDKPYIYLVNCLVCKTTIKYNKEMVVINETEFNKDFKEFGELEQML